MDHSAVFTQFKTDLIDLHNAEIATRLLEQRTTLLKNGYEPIPCAGKRPVVEAWTEGDITDRRIKVETYYHRHARNTGLRTGCLVPIDIDIEEADDFEPLMQVVAEKAGISPLIRIGSKGCAILYRNNETPINKVEFGEPKSADFKRQHGRKPRRIEIFGTSGQIIAYGTHPDTGLDYRWLDEGIEPLQIPLRKLPLLTPAAIYDLRDALMQKMNELGFIMQEHRQMPTNDPVPAGELTDAHKISAMFYDQLLSFSSVKGPSRTGYYNACYCPGCGSNDWKFGFRVNEDGGFFCKCFHDGCEFNWSVGWSTNRPLGDRERRLFEAMGGDVVHLPRGRV